MTKKDNKIRHVNIPFKLNFTYLNELTIDRNNVILNKGKIPRVFVNLEAGTFGTWLLTSNHKRCNNEECPSFLQRAR